MELRVALETIAEENGIDIRVVVSQGRSKVDGHPIAIEALERAIGDIKAIQASSIDANALVVLRSAIEGLVVIERAIRHVQPSEVADHHVHQEACGCGNKGCGEIPWT